MAFWTLVDNHSALKAMLDAFPDSSSQTPVLFLDLEGENLGKDGKLLIMQILVLSTPHVYLVDCLTLGKDTFEVTNSNGGNLKQILENSLIKKAMFDVRNDSAALYHQYGVTLAGVDDIQLMEVATRTSPKTYLHGLAKCIQFDVLGSLSDEQSRELLRLKERGQRLFDPKLGGSYTVFASRPLDREIQKYCVQDVCVLPSLWNSYSAKIEPLWRTRMLDETERRIREVQSPHYNGKGQHMARGPGSWRGFFNNRALKAEKLMLTDAEISRCLDILTDNDKPEESNPSDAASAERIGGMSSLLAKQSLASC